MEATRFDHLLRGIQKYSIGLLCALAAPGGSACYLECTPARGAVSRCASGDDMALRQTGAGSCTGRRDEIGPQVTTPKDASGMTDPTEQRRTKSAPEHQRNLSQRVIFPDNLTRIRCSQYQERQRHLEPRVQQNRRATPGLVLADPAVAIVRVSLVLF